MSPKNDFGNGKTFSVLEMVHAAQREARERREKEKAWRKFRAQKSFLLRHEDHFFYWDVTLIVVALALLFTGHAYSAFLATIFSLVFTLAEGVPAKIINTRLKKQFDQL